MLQAASRFASNVLFATASGGAADAVCQAIEAGCAEPSASGARGFDWRRSFAFSAFTGVYIGGFCSGLYTLYPRAARLWLRRAPTPREEGIAATLLDNFVHVYAAAELKP